jgi:hypothetical protein
VNNIADMSAAEDTVVLVFSLIGITGVAAFSQAMELSAVIPTPWLLAKVPSEGTLIAKLRACDL